MTAVLCANLYQATRLARKAADKPQKTLPVSNHLLIRTHEGRVQIVPFAWEEREKKTQTCPAVIDAAFATCVPARAFSDWLYATQNPKAKHGEDRIELQLDPALQLLTIRAGNTRATFKCMDADNFLPV